MDKLISDILDCYWLVNTRKGRLYLTILLVLLFVIIVLAVHYFGE